MQDGATNKTLDEAQERAKWDDANVERDVDRPQADFVNPYCRVSRDWPIIAFLCSGCRCDQADFAQTSGPNEGVFLFPGHYSKCLIIEVLMWN